MNYSIKGQNKTNKQQQQQQQQKNPAKQEVSGPSEAMLNTEQDWMEAVDGSVLKIWLDHRCFAKDIQI